MSPEPPPETLDDKLGLERLIFFSDAVFAIAITLLALEIRLPDEATSLGNGALWRSLAALWPKYLSYFVSFMVIGSIWLSHHSKFRFIRRYDRSLLLLNLWLLMVVAFIPFPTAVLSDSGNRTATIFYAATMIVASLLLTRLWLYASHRHRLTTQELSPEEQRYQLHRSLIVPGVFLVAIGLAFINSSLAQGWLVVASIINYLPLKRRREDYQRAGSSGAA